jgi:hypothetical protein
MTDKLTTTTTNLTGDKVYFNALLSCDADCYQLFNTNITKHFAKFPNPIFKRTLQPLIDNNLITIGYPDKLKNLILGQVIHTYDDKIAAIGINHVTHDIDNTGNSLSFDKIIGSIYFTLIEFTIGSTFYTKAKADEILAQRTCHYMEYMFVKSLKLFELYPEKRKLLDVVIRYFFYRFLIEKNSIVAYDIATKETQEIKTVIPLNKLDKYSGFTSVFDALYDLNIVSMTPNNMKYVMTNTLGMFSYISVTSSYSQSIAAFILSKYKHPNFDKLFISTDMINSLEEHVLTNYISKISVDITSFKKNYVVK